MRSSAIPFERATTLLVIVMLLSAAIAALPHRAVAQAEAIAQVGTFEDSGQAPDADVLYAWQVPAGEDLWRIEIEGTPERSIWVALLGPDGERIEQTSKAGIAVLPDLDLDAGGYTIIVPRISGDDADYMVRASVEPTRYDAEPNDRPEIARPITDGIPVTGRLGRSGSDDDVYALTIPPGDEQLRDVTLESASEKDREVCLHGRDFVKLQCRRSVDTVEMLDLELEPGPYHLLVRGSTDLDEPYVLSVGSIGARPADYEAEPNDSFATASLFDPSLGVRGRSSRIDWDFHRLRIEGEPQLWTIEASGVDLDRLALVNGSADELMSSTPRGDRETAVLHDVLLVEGTHRLKVRAYGGDYRITMTPLGPRDESAEREPNSDPIRAEAYRIGSSRTGRLVTSEDIDDFQFTLTAPERVGFSLEQPGSAELEVRMESGGNEVVRQRAREPGGPIEMDLLLDAGEYLVSIRPVTPSESPYTLTSERLGRAQLPADQEPNDEPWQARPAPPSLAWSGTRVGRSPDYDFVELPPLPTSTSVTINHSEARPGVWLYTDGGETKLPVTRVEDGLFVAEEVPAGSPLLLRLQSEGPYEASVEADGWVPGMDAVAPMIEIDVRTATEIVAAYWPEAQHVEAVASITNTGESAVDLLLDAMASHYAWQPILGADRLELAAGETIAVPIEIEIRPDVWADAPVAIDIVASGADGGAVASVLTLDATGDATPVGSHVGWAVPDALLGGLNVAGAALGGAPAGTLDASREPLLYDDVTPPGGGFTKGSQTLPIELSVDLAGDAPIDIRGTIINPLASVFRLDQRPKEFELLLSTDGSTWTPALDGELAPLPIDQAFVLDEPMPATHAMLRIHSFHAGGRHGIALGEWKVIAEPGAVPDDMPANIADPIRGGHVARHTPFTRSFAEFVQILDDDPKRQAATIDLENDEGFELIVAFQDGRAAQIESLVWHDPDGTDPEFRVDRVEVALSTEGPLGPWTSAGSWALDRGADGSVPAFEFDGPQWARYVRLTSPFREGARRVEMPAPLEVLERPTEASYRSVLGEWGYTSSDGPYEWLVDAQVAAAPSLEDAGDTQAAATPLTLGERRADRVEILEDTDWLRVAVPAGDNALEVDLRGNPTATAKLSLFEPDGTEVPTEFSLRPNGAVRYTAAVEPGDYDLRIEQPPFNVAFTFDTSGSMGPFLDFVLQGVREFASDVEPGRESATIIPFGRQPLLESWTDQPLLLADAVANYLPADDSSNAEEGLLASAAALTGREGAKAILIVTDAETGSIQLGPEVWSTFDELRPSVYSVHVGGNTYPEGTRNLMRGWADSNGGHYAYPTTKAEMERAFERMSTRLRRPADYSVEARSLFIDRSPALLSVVASADQPAALAPGVGVEIILDTSGSMRKKLAGERRIDIAKRSLRSLVTNTLTDGVPVAIRTFGGGKGKAARCRTQLTLPLGPLDSAAAGKLIRKLDAEKRTKTPLAAAIAAVADDLAAIEGSRTVVLVTDGAETCKGDPEAEIIALREAGIDVNLNIVGFALEDEELKNAMAGWAEVGAGSYFDASSADDLAAAIATAVSAPYRVFALPSEDGAEPVTSGTVNGTGVTLEPGFYRVEVLLDPLVVYERVEVPGGSSVSLELPSEEDPA